MNVIHHGSYKRKKGTTTRLFLSRAESQWTKQEEEEEERPKEEEPKKKGKVHEKAPKKKQERERKKTKETTTVLTSLLLKVFTCWVLEREIIKRKGRVFWTWEHHSHLRGMDPTFVLCIWSHILAPNVHHGEVHSLETSSNVSCEFHT
jgi:predicted ATP-dependent protease